jgi:rRNA maturation endonuclease Nob1
MNNLSNYPSTGARYNPGKKCDNCRKLIPQDSNFCPYCSEKIKE